MPAPFPARVRSVALPPGIVTYPAGWLDPGLVSGCLDPDLPASPGAAQGDGREPEAGPGEPEAGPGVAEAGPGVAEAGPGVAEAGPEGAEAGPK